MADGSMYHEGMRQLQDARDTRRLADRLEQVTVHTTFTDEDRAFTHRCPMFFIAMADAAGRPDCSYKGGPPGFVHVVDPRTLAIPDYDGNGRYRTWGNVRLSPHVGLLFLDFERPKTPAGERPGAVFVVRVTAETIFRAARATFTRCRCSSIRCTCRGRITCHRSLPGKRTTTFATTFRRAIVATSSAS